MDLKCLIKINFKLNILFIIDIIINYFIIFNNYTIYLYNKYYFFIYTKYLYINILKFVFTYHYIK